MQYLQIYISSLCKKTQIILGSLFLVCGFSIYLLFRSKTIHLYQWLNDLGLIDYIESMRIFVKDWRIPDFVKYNLPDGLYCLSYILLMNVFWPGKGINKLFVVAIIPAVAIIHEISQGIGLIRGTFDTIDLICYIVPLILYFIFTKNSQLFSTT